ncbi:MAG TPA: hypothetical protein VH110_02730 [Candidatus Acidoferrum sp.]|jgi:hypothetical protein|nr:hypothetical protein [Candidatus Acidoferrum sp.]
MDDRTLAVLAVWWALFSVPAVIAQTNASPSTAPVSLSAGETIRSDPKPAPPGRSPAGFPLRSGPVLPARSSKTGFLLLSAGVYAASFADMHQTLARRNNSGWYEADPLARPLVRLPAPAYYATGLAMATGINWLSWKMAHSRRWHRLAPIPQLLAISGNLYGFRSNLH